MRRASAILAFQPAATAVTFGYARVSTEQQAGETRTSLEDQRKAIDAVAAKLGRTIEHHFIDAGASGANAEGRPAFMQLVDFCESHPRAATAPGVVLALNDSRWGRFENPEEASYWRVRLLRSGWSVRFAEGDDVGDGIGRMVMRTIGAAQASEYRENIRRNAIRGRRAAVAAGYWCGRAPFGFRRQVVFPADRARLLENGVRKAPDERVKLTPGPDDEVATVQWMFDTYGTRQLSMRALARALNVRVPRDGGWPIQTVHGMLANRTYLGEVMTGRYLGNGQHGSRRVERDRSTWLVTLDAHAPIVTSAQFAAVAQRLSTTDRDRHPITHLLTGLVTCATCGRHYAGGGIGGRKGYRRPYYRCSRGFDSRYRCPGGGGTILCERLDTAVVRALADVIASVPVQSAIERALDRDAALERGRNVASERGQLERRRRQLVKRRARLIEAIETGVLSTAEVQERLTQLRTDADAISASIEQLRFATVAVTPTAIERERVLATASDFATLAARLTGPALRRLVEPWIERAVFDKHTRTLTLVIRRIPAAVSCAASASKVDTRRIRHVVGRTLRFVSGRGSVEVRPATAAAIREALSA